MTTTNHLFLWKQNLFVLQHDTWFIHFLEASWTFSKFSDSDAKNKKNLFHSNKFMYSHVRTNIHKLLLNFTWISSIDKIASFFQQKLFSWFLDFVKSTIARWQMHCIFQTILSQWYFNQYRQTSHVMITDL